MRVRHEKKILKKARCSVKPRKITISLLILASFLLAEGVTFCAGPEASEKEKQEYKQERARIKALEKSFTPGPTNDLESYEKFADEIQNKWKQRNKEYYARLMLEICGPLSSGAFKDDRRYDAAKKYALSALAEPNAIPLTLELELTGHVVTLMYTPNAPKGEDFARRRKKDVQIRLHAWKRLMDAIDPNWDPNDLPVANLTPPAATGLPSGVEPEAIEDATLRARYEAALQRNREMAERYSEQYNLRKWLKRFPRRAEPFIILEYSEPPFNLEELEKYLKDYIADEKTRARILDAVTKNIAKQSQTVHSDSAGYYVTGRRGHHNGLGPLSRLRPHRIWDRLGKTGRPVDGKG